MANFSKNDLGKHLGNQECPNFHVYCNLCGEKVLVKDRMYHSCALEKLYENTKTQIINM